MRNRYPILPNLVFRNSKLRWLPKVYGKISGVPEPIKTIGFKWLWFDAVWLRIDKKGERFDDALWYLGTIAGKLGCTRLRRWIWDWWQWRTNYEPFGRRRSRNKP
jgi:hypothetical protein